MRSKTFPLALALAACAAPGCASSHANSAGTSPVTDTYPNTPVKAVTDTLHGHVIEDVLA